MYVRNRLKFGKPVKIINAGEFYVSEEDEIIGTLLGSCVAVCLHDPVNMIAGMNHFMLPGRISKVDIFKDRTAKYGITAIKELLEMMDNFKAERKNLTAKIFGGGHVLKYSKVGSDIPLDNIRIAKIMLELEDIPIVESDVGADYTRKLLMDVKSGKVYLKKSQNKLVYEQIISEEEEYARRSFKE